MIKIREFGITADSHGYTVGKLSVYKDKKTGDETEILTASRYFGNLQGCLRYIRKQMHLEAMKLFDGTIGDAIDMLDEIDEKFERLIAGAEKE